MVSVCSERSLLLGSCSSCSRWKSIWICQNELNKLWMLWSLCGSCWLWNSLPGWVTRLLLFRHFSFNKSLCYNCRLQHTRTNTLTSSRAQKAHLRMGLFETVGAGEILSSELPGRCCVRLRARCLHTSASISPSAPPAWAQGLTPLGREQIAAPAERKNERLYEPLLDLTHR